MHVRYGLLIVLTASAACGSGPTGPKTAETEPAESHIVVMKAQAQPPPDAAPDAAPPSPASLITCAPGTQMMPAPAPEPTWFCAKPDGTRQGPFVTLFPDGTTQIAGNNRGGKLDGTWQRFYPGGALAEAGSYKLGKKDGHWRQLAPDGHPLGEYDMKAGTGTEKYWFSDGPLYRERALRGGLPWGPARIYDHDGTLVDAARFYAGRLEGSHAVGSRSTMRIEEEFHLGVRRNARQIWQFWELVMDEHYDTHGKLDGAFTIWRDAIKQIPRVTGTYDHGKRNGTWSWFDRENNKEEEGDYDEGKKTGAWFEWFENKLVFSGSYTDGKPDGDFVYYNRNGDELGRFTITDGTGMMYTYYPNKKVATKAYLYQGELGGIYEELSFRLPQKVMVEGHYAGGQKHGWWREWDDNHDLVLEEHWRYGRLDGVVHKYDAGQLLVESTYKRGKADGPYTEFRNGKRALAGQFAADRRTGTWTTYDASGDVVLVATYKDGVLDGPWRQLVGGAVVQGQMVAGRRAGTWTRTDRAGAIQKITYDDPGAVTNR